MKKKVCVYAITKNEEKFVNRWVNSMKEADEIYVLDTGSTDNTVSLLKEQGVNVKIEKIDPWRFDIARNKSLEMIPYDIDICVCTDLDEVFEKGWREKLEKLWTEDITRVAYNYNWSLDDNNKPLVNFYIEKIHTRSNYTWKHPVHEILAYTGKGEEKKVTTDEITLNHYPDQKKSRGSYLPLLELSVKEDPNDDRNLHYLGREYMYYGRWNDCIDTLIKHLQCQNATWRDERSASMRFIARSYKKLKRYEESKMWLNKAITETPYLRDPYMELALLYYELNEWKEVEVYVTKALEIKDKEKTYINEQFSWDATPYDLLALSYYYQERYLDSLNAINTAIQYNEKDERLQKNKEIIENMIK